MSGSPLVSVIMSAYNAGPWLPPALASLVAQTERRWELIAVDDASTDGTAGVLADWAVRDRRIRVLRNDRNRGISGSLNRAAYEARGRWLARMDADDLSRPERLAAQRHAVERAPAVAAATCFIDVVDASGVVRRGARGVAQDWELLPWFSLFYNRVGGGGQLFCARETFEALGGFDETIRYGEDRDFWLRLLGRGPLALVRRPLYGWRSSAGSATKTLQRRFRYSEDSLAAGVRAIEAWCGVAVSRDEAVQLRDFWQRYDDGSQNWDAVQRRLWELAAAFRGPSWFTTDRRALRRTVAEGWWSLALRAALRRDRRGVSAHLRRARAAAGVRWPVALGRWLTKLACVGGRADRLI